MNRYKNHLAWIRRLAGGLALLTGIMMIPTTSLAQQKQAPPLAQPRITSITPAGGKAGTSFDVMVTGQNIDQARALHFDHPGIRADFK